MAEEGDILDAGEEGEAPIVNQNPYFISAAVSSAMTFLASYGWFIVLGSIFVMVIWSNLKKPVRKFLKKRKGDVIDNLSAEEAYERMESMDRARARMQADHDHLVAEEAERRREIEEEKAAQRINDYDAMQAGKAKSSTLDKLQIKQKLNEAPTSKVLKKNKDAKPMRSSDTSPLGGSCEYTLRYRPGGSRPRGGG